MFFFFDDSNFAHAYVEVVCNGFYGPLIQFERVLNAIQRASVVEFTGYSARLIGSY